MPKAMFMKAGESLKDIQMGGKLFRNVIMTGKMEANKTHMLPGARSKAFAHKGEEIHVMIKGEVEFHVGAEKFILQEGDLLSHNSTIPHRAANKGTMEAVYVTISTPPSFSMFQD